MKKICRSILLGLLLLQQSYSTYAQTRLHSSSYYRYYATSQSFTPEDSTRYEYQGTRKSDFDNFLTDFNADKTLKFYYDPSTNQYEESARNYNSYDNNGNVTLHATFFVNGGVQQDTNTRSEYKYDANNRIIERSDYRKYSATSWEGLAKINYTYNSQGDINETIQEKWDLNTKSWQNNARTVYTYTASKLTEELTYDWDGSAWRLFARDTYHYNGNNPDSIYTEYYNILASQWEYSSLDVNSYTSSNDNDTSTHHTYNKLQSIWEPSSRYLYTYDNSHNILTWITQKFVSGNFENDTKQQTTYNTNNLRTFSETEKWNKQSGKFEFYEGSISASSRLYWYYEPVTADVNDPISNNSIAIYPNPASSNIHIQMELPQGNGLLDFAIYSQEGKQMRFWHEPYSGGLYSRAIDVTDIPNGLYIIHNLNTGNSTQFIIAH